MRLKTFPGGIHPPYHKEQTAGRPIVHVMPGKLLFIPLLQHAGAPCESLVRKGDFVRMGDKIGDSGAFVSSPVHSSVSGAVTTVEKRLHPNGTMVETVVIENDGLYTPVPAAPRRPENMTPKDIVAAVHEAGIVGMGGAGFPVHIKLSPPKGKAAEYIVVNGAECEPYLSSDHRSMLEHTGDIVYGIRTLMKAAGAPRAIVAVEDNKPDAAEALTRALADDPDVSVCMMDTKYPQGSEKHVIRAVLGREVPSGGLPIDVGVIVNNIDTCIAVAAAIREGTPVIRRRVTIAGRGVKEPGVYELSIGMTFAEALDAAGGLLPGVRKLLMGGPMMGTAQYDTDVPIIKTTSGILALTAEETRAEKEQVCLRCGKCVDACPMHLMPLLLSRAGRAADAERAAGLHAKDCIECGCCSYVCPSGRYLVESIRLAKAQAMALTANRKKEGTAS